VLYFNPKMSSSESDTSGSESDDGSKSPADDVKAGSSRARYTNLEINRLLGLIEENRKEIENKKTDFYSQGKKSKAWARLTTAYNSSSEIQKRTVKQLLKKWDNLKGRSKKDVRKLQSINQFTAIQRVLAVL